jgi:hypothetical protein
MLLSHSDTRWLTGLTVMVLVWDLILMVSQITVIMSTRILHVTCGYHYVMTNNDVSSCELPWRLRSIGASGSGKPPPVKIRANNLAGQDVGAWRSWKNDLTAKIGNWPKVMEFPVWRCISCVVVCKRCNIAKKCHKKLFDFETFYQYRDSHASILSKSDTNVCIRLRRSKKFA